ncbi:hypothetical protein [Mesorhizobium sp. GbtcB19]|nr:hypothetical protein [Mesorhizobium sp. GbtcB19]
MPDRWAHPDYLSHRWLSGCLSIIDLAIFAMALLRLSTLSGLARPDAVG